MQFDLSAIQPRNPAIVLGKRHILCVFDHCCRTFIHTVQYPRLDFEPDPSDTIAEKRLIYTCR